MCKAPQCIMVRSYLPWLVGTLGFVGLGNAMRHALRRRYTTLSNSFCMGCSNLRCFHQWRLDIQGREFWMRWEEKIYFRGICAGEGAGSENGMHNVGNIFRLSCTYVSSQRRVAGRWYDWCLSAPPIAVAQHHLTILPNTLFSTAVITQSLHYKYTLTVCGTFLRGKSWLSPPLTISYYLYNNVGRVDGVMPCSCLFRLEWRGVSLFR